MSGRWSWRALLLVVIAPLGVALYLVQTTSERVKLRVVLEPGDTIAYRLLFKSVGTIGIAGKPDGTIEEQRQTEIRLKVGAVDATGVATMAAQFEVEQRVVLPWWHTGLLPGLGAPALPADYRSDSIELSLSPEGKAALIRDGHPAPRARARYTPDGVTSFDADARWQMLVERFFTVLPGTPVAVGDRWDAEMMVGMGTLDLKTEITYWVVAVDEDEVELRIDGAVAVSPAPGHGFETGDADADKMLAKFAESTEVRRSAITGSERISRHDGLLIERSLSAQILITGKRADGQFDRKMRVQSAISVTRL